jgi:ankyrin repeat protein|eukprot:Transcript_14474.p2 GENE.Transcript_14474~~Transcript_14474.p2  ORF type:complete len:217 (+),score=54.87 Transcript_14474:370-1020(+)
MGCVLARPLLESPYPGRLHAAPRARVRSHQVAQWLIDDVQAEVDSRDNHSQTPLHHAAVKGQATLVQLLLKRGADPMARDRAGWTPIHACSRSNHTDAALELIATLEPARALVREKTVELDKSAGLDAQRVRKELAKAEDHADMLNVRGPRGETPLHRAAFWGHTGMVQTLLEAGAVAAPVNEAGLTPFDVICKGVDQPLALPAITKLLRSPTPAA